MPLSRRRQVLLVSLAAAVGIAAITTGVMLRGNSGAPAVDPRIEELIPEAGSEVLLQQVLGIDLVDNPRFVIQLFVNGTQIPPEELIKAEATNRVVYQSGEGRSVESLRAERNCLRAVFYPLTDSENPTSSGEHVWCFNAS